MFTQLFHNCRNKTRNQVSVTLEAADEPVGAIFDNTRIDSLALLLQVRGRFHLISLPPTCVFCNVCFFCDGSESEGWIFENQMLTEKGRTHFARDDKVALQCYNSQPWVIVVIWRSKFHCDRDSIFNLTERTNSEGGASITFLGVGWAFSTALGRYVSTVSSSRFLKNKVNWFMNVREYVTWPANEFVER